jgi:hypothetical protein
MLSGRHVMLFCDSSINAVRGYLPYRELGVRQLKVLAGHVNITSKTFMD